MIKIEIKTIIMNTRSGLRPIQELGARSSRALIALDKQSERQRAVLDMNIPNSDIKLVLQDDETPSRVENVVQYNVSGLNYET